MKAPLLLSLLSTLLATTALADENVRLVLVQKPTNPDTMIEVTARIDSHCNVGKLDFFWFTQSSGKRSRMGCMATRAANLAIQFVDHPGPHKAKCPDAGVLAKNSAFCTNKFIKIDEISKVNSTVTDPVIVVKSVWTPAMGTGPDGSPQCNTGAYIDMGEGAPTQLVAVKVKGKAGKTDLGNATKLITARAVVQSVQVVARDGKPRDAWTCDGGPDACTTTLTIPSDLTCIAHSGDLLSSGN